MALPGSGQITAGQISDEFGRNASGNRMSLGAYRLTQNVGSLSFNGIDSGVPNSGTIRFSDFYGKRLNVVVDFHSGGQESRQNAKNRYNGNNVTVIGGFRGRKEAGSKILIHVKKTIGSAKGNQANVALRTGTWNSDVVLSVDVGSSGRLYGAGGDGGQGADSWSDAGSTNGGSGVPGSGSGDTFAARLTPGEFVMSKGAVDHWGAGMLASMNAMGGGTNRPTMIGGVPGYAGGGMAMGSGS